MCSSSIAVAVSFLVMGGANGNLGLPSKDGIKCKVQSAVDSEMSGLPAFKFLVPEGWQATTSFRWLPPSRMAFASDLSVATPDLHAMVDCLEHTVLTYSSGMAGQPGKGVLIEKASDYLRFKLSRLTTSLQGVTDVAVVTEENTELPPDDFQKIGQRFNSGDSMHRRSFLHQAGFLKASFKLNNTPMTVSLGTLVFGETSTIQIPGMSRPSSVSQVNRVGPTVTIMLESNAPAKMVNEAKVIASSFQMTGEFHEYWVKMTTHAAQVQLGANAATLKAENANWHEHAMASFRNQMDAKSGVSHDFCNMVANQQDYKLGDGIVTLPNDFKGWWDANSSTLVIADNPQYVPTGAGTNNFKALQAVHAGDPR